MRLRLRFTVLLCVCVCFSCFNSVLLLSFYSNPVEISSGLQRKRSFPPSQLSVWSRQTWLLIQRVCSEEQAPGDRKCICFYSNSGGDWVFSLLSGVRPQCVLQLASLKRIGAHKMKDEREGVTATGCQVAGVQ